MTSIKASKKAIDSAALSVQCREQKIHRHNAHIAHLDRLNIEIQGFIERDIAAQRAAVFQLMNRLSYRKFIAFMRGHHGLY